MGRKENQAELCHQGMAGSKFTDVLAIWGLEALLLISSDQAPPVCPQPLCQGQLYGLNPDDVTEVTPCVSKQE